MTKKIHKAFLVLSKSPDNLSWVGNDGYEEDPNRFYAFDSKVANSKNILPGVFLVVRLDDTFLGIGKVHTIDTVAKTKTTRKCPACNKHTLDKRKNDFRCSLCKGVFTPDEVLMESLEVVGVRAYFEKCWSPAARRVSGREVEPLLSTGDTQSAIRGLSSSELDSVADLLGVELPEFEFSGYYEL
jgi:ssDNA-binding Zn-finger/Zn-ribbon topoisomerase 1